MSIDIENRSKFITVGPILKDILNGTTQIGGPAVYASHVAQKLGYDTHLITKIPQGHEFVAALKASGLTVHILPTTKNIITTVRIDDAQGGKREINLIERQDKIILTDPLPLEVLRDAVILVGPATKEDVDYDIFSLLAKYGFLGVIPQAYLGIIRQDRKGPIIPSQMKSFFEALSHAQIVSLSEEDLTYGNNGRRNRNLLDAIRDHTRLVILTNGEKGSDIFLPDGESIHMDAFALLPGEVKNLTGAGDTFATAFISAYTFLDSSNAQRENVRIAASFATLYTALKIAGITGESGMGSVPNLQQVSDYIARNERRIEEFNKRVGGLSILFNGK